MPDKIDSLGLWALKWIFIPIFTIFIFVMVLDTSVGSWKCRQLREKHGYVEFKYVPRYRYNGGYCILEGKSGKDGIVDDKAVQKIEMTGLI